MGPGTAEQYGLKKKCYIFGLYIINVDVLKSPQKHFIRATINIKYGMFDQILFIL